MPGITRITLPFETLRRSTGFQLRSCLASLAGAQDYSQDQGPSCCRRMEVLVLLKKVGLRTWTVLSSRTEYAYLVALHDLRPQVLILLLFIVLERHPSICNGLANS